MTSRSGCGILGSWSESHGSSGNASDKRIFYTSFTGGSGNNQYLTRSLLPAFSATSGLSEKGRKLEKKDTRMNNLFSNQESLVSIKHNTVITTSKQIAITFGKTHRHVLDSVRNLAASTFTFTVKILWLCVARPTLYHRI